TSFSRDWSSDVCSSDLWSARLGNAPAPDPCPLSRCRLLMSTHSRAVDHQILMNIRLSAPVWPGSPALPASSDAILSHCPSLSSYRFASADRPPCSTRRPVKHSSADL